MTHDRRFDWLLFDLGGVIIDFSGPVELLRWSPPETDLAAIKRRWVEDAAVRAFERGDLEADEFARRFLETWNFDLEPAEFLRQFTTWTQRVLPGATELLAELRPQVRLACLSNTNSLHWQRNLQIFRIDELFEQCLASHLLRMVKPDHEIFAHAVAALGAPAQRIAFFDDSPINVAGAERAGLAAYLVDGVDELRRTLRDLGLELGAGGVDQSRVAPV